jgi:hypothetical protein
MPKFLERKLKKEYPNNPHAVFGTMNKMGAMHGNKETAKGKAMEMKHHSGKGTKARLETVAKKMMFGGKYSK